MLDDINGQIIDILREDGRSSNASIARRLGVSEGTIRRRLNMLINSGIVKVNVILNSAKMGLSTEAIIGIQVDPDKVEMVGESLSKLNEIEWVSITTGSFDMFVWVTVQSAEQLGFFLRNEVATIPGVRKTETFMNLFKKKP
tara:strand:- start:1180 stop:1605 length:426 start_codon:yes stop_codon:yes gene_type:complete